ncbi:MAG: hypothetical protein V1859_02605 [archaeon]
MNISKTTEKYIAERPSVKDCLKKGLINHSALAREIGKKTAIQNFSAILAAAKRYKFKLKENKTLQKRILEVLRNSKIEIKNKIATIVIEKPRYFHDLLSIEEKIKNKKGNLSLIEGTQAITIITSIEFLPLIKEAQKSNILKINEGLVQINIICPPEIESTPGVINHVYSSFAENGINIVEEMSCWTDVMILINENDLARAMGFLKF